MNSNEPQNNFHMESKNGFQELISLLQYMKDTRIDNPEIITKDSRILELDGIVQEVKSSEKWELKIFISHGERSVQ